MKPQILIFLVIIGIILFIVYPSGDNSVEEAKDRLLNQSDERNDDLNGETPDLGSNTDEEVNNTPEENIPDNQNNQADITAGMNEDSLEVETLPASDLDLPSFVDYGDAVRTSDRSFVYNQVRGMEIFSENIVQELTCDDLTEFLSSRIRSWYFWNTCRTIDGERGLKFNVLRLDGEQYIYERHYLDVATGMYGILELEQGEGIDKDMLPEKNTEFRDKEFPLIEVGDGLMRELVRSN